MLLTKATKSKYSASQRAYDEDLFQINAEEEAQLMNLAPLCLQEGAHVNWLAHYLLVLAGKDEPEWPSDCSTGKRSATEQEMNHVPVKPSELEVVLAPNPTSSTSNLIYKTIGEGSLHVSLVNLNGVELAFFTIQEEGMGSIPLPIDNLPGGIYVVKLQAQSGKARQLKLILR